MSESRESEAPHFSLNGGDAAPEPGVFRGKGPVRAVAAGVALLAFLVYLPVLRAGFVEWDDPAYVINNTYLRSLDGALLRWALFGFHSANWHPLTWISHALDYALWGLDPLGHHLTNMLLHAANSSLVVLLGQKILERWRREEGLPDMNPALPCPASLAAAGLAGVLFALHPVHVESVAWVSERKDLLCALFYLAALLAYVSRMAVAGEGRRAGFPFPALLFFCLALASKPMAVSLPLVLLILDGYPLGRLALPAARTRALLEKIPFVLLSLASCLVTIAAQKAGEALVLTETVRLGDRLLVAVRSLALYLQKLFVPIGLSPLYPYPARQEIGLLSPSFALPLAVLALIVAVPLFRRGVRRSWLVAGGTFLAMLLPVIGVVQVGNQAMADRYLYLPGIPILLLVAAAALRFVAGSGRPVAALRGVLALSAAAFLALGGLTVRQCAIWENGVVFWTYVIDHTPPQRSLALAYRNRGAAYSRSGEFGRAIDDYTTALSLLPGDGATLQNRGVARARTGDFRRSVEDLTAALAISPGDPAVLYDRGSTFLGMGELRRAEDDFSAALSSSPRHSGAYYNRGIVRARSGDLEGAIGDFTSAIRLKGAFPEGYANRGAARAEKGDLPGALEDFSAALALRPDPFFYENRGLLRQRSGDPAGAREDFRSACSQGSPEGCRLLDTMR